MKKLTKKFLTLFLISASIIACEKEEDSIEPMTINPSSNTMSNITAADITKSLDENPLQNTILGQVKPTTTDTNPSFTYSIKSTVPPGAMNMSPAGGYVRVSDQTLYDFEVNPIITGIVTVSNGSDFKDVNVTVSLNDVNDTTSTTGSNHFVVDSYTVKVDGSNNNILITAGGTMTEILSVNLIGITEFPAVTTEYSVTNGEASISLNTPRSYTRADHLVGKIIVKPLGDGEYNINIVAAELWPYIGSTPSIANFNQEFDVEFITGNLSIGGNAKTILRKTYLSINNGISAFDNAKLRIEVFGGVFTMGFESAIPVGTYTITKGIIPLKIAPGAVHVKWDIYHGTNGQDDKIFGDSGTVIITKVGDYYSVDFTNLILVDDTDATLNTTATGSINFKK